MAHREVEVRAIMRIGSCLLEMGTVVEEEVINHLLLLLLLGLPTNLSLVEDMAEDMAEGEDVQDPQVYPVALQLGKEDKLGLLLDWV